MPELPEVETIVNDLKTLLIGRRITDVAVNWEGIIAQPSDELSQGRPQNRKGRLCDSSSSVSEFKRRIKNQRILDIRRRGKYIIFDLSRGDSLLIHLRMAGQLLIGPCPTKLESYTRLILHLDNGQQLRFADMRKLGRVYLVEDAEAIVGMLGPEPLADDFKLEDFARILERRRGRIKSLLLNQRFIAGIGNIYANEILFAAGIHPLRKADTLAPAEIEALYHAIRRVLRRAIAERGTTFDGAYLDVRGRRGQYQESLRVLRREGKPCPRCGTPIVRIALGGRGTYFCPRCQE